MQAVYFLFVCAVDGVKPSERDTPEPYDSAQQCVGQGDGPSGRWTRAIRFRVLNNGLNDKMCVLFRRVEVTSSGLACPAFPDSES